MKPYVEIRWHGRGGQGTVTAAKLLAETALSGGKYVQAFPEYGPERMGAPLRAYNRLSQEPIYAHCQVTNPDIVVVVDATLLDAVDVTEGCFRDAVFVVNTPEEPKKIKARLGDSFQVYTVDATKIALETIGKPLPNTPLLGALAKVSDLIELEKLLADLKKNFEKKFSAEVIEANVQAVLRAYKEVKGE